MHLSFEIKFMRAFLFGPDQLTWTPFLEKQIYRKLMNYYLKKHFSVADIFSNLCSNSHVAYWHFLSHICVECASHIVTDEDRRTAMDVFWSYKYFILLWAILRQNCFYNIRKSGYRVALCDIRLHKARNFMWH